MLMYALEFFADKIPGVDSLWDVIHTFIRIPAGALLAAGSHATKAASRAIINTSPEPFTNWLASLTEDAMTFAGVGLAVFKPVFFLVGLGIFAGLVIWLLPKIWRGLRRFFSGFRHPLRSAQETRMYYRPGHQPEPPPQVPPPVV